ncbi:MAG: hypothetical protein Kow0026_22220 [Oricola sp.]
MRGTGSRAGSVAGRRLLRAGAAALLLFALAVPAGAISRIRADLNSCATLQRTLAREGAAVIRWPSRRIANYFLYDRYVGPHYLCPLGEVPVPATVPAADNPRCLVFRCEHVEPRFRFPDD